MTLDDFNELRKSTETDRTISEMGRITLGFALLSQYTEGRGGVAVEHDVLYASGPGPDSPEWSPGFLKTLCLLGWQWDAIQSSWAIFV